MQDMLRVNAARPHFRTVKAGEALYFQGDECRNIYVLLDGWAFRHQGLENGRRQILDFSLSGALFGLSAVASMAHGVETLTPCVFSAFARDNLFDLLQRVPALSLRFVELMAGAEARAFEHLTSVGRRAARERVAHLLLELVIRSRGQASAAAGMSVPLMQPHIADALGLASETVCRVLAAMRKDGVLILRGQRLEVLDIDRLTEEAGVEPEVLPTANWPTQRIGFVRPTVETMPVRSSVTA
jgi:CRP-like cAMP-binding protein